MLVGPAAGGKTTTRKILRKALTLVPGFQANEDEDGRTIGSSVDTESKITGTVSFEFCLRIRMMIQMFCKIPHFKKLVICVQPYCSIKSSTADGETRTRNSSVINRVL